MNMRRGIGSLEIILLAIFVLMLGSTLLMVWQFSRISVPNATPGKNIVAAFEYAVEALATDARTARSVLAGRELVRLESASGTSIEWSFSGGNLKRSPDGTTPEIIVSRLRDGGFTSASATPDLFSIWMVPADTSAMPVFTSFALRGAGL